MKAYKCDRCGDLYEGFTQSVTDYVVYKSNDNYLDFCPKCQKKLNEFINGDTDTIVNLTVENEKTCGTCKYGPVINCDYFKCHACVAHNMWEENE